MKQCNYCLLEDIKRRARQDRQRVVILPARRLDRNLIGGIDVFRFPQSMWTVSQFKALEAATQQKWWVCWFMELSGHCVC
jgi:hypothetical protein